MIIGFLTVEMFMQDCQSLKDKRMIIQSVKDKIAGKFNISVAEVDFLDKWQRAALAFVIVTNKKSFADEVLQKIFKLLDNDFRFEVVKYKFGYK